MKFKDRYSSRTPSAGTTFTEESRTLQSEYPQTTIDYYLKRYSATGVLGDPVRAQEAEFLDVSEVGDFQAMQDKVLAVRNAFMQLPAEERRRFGEDPSLWVQEQIALAEQRALDEAKKLVEQAKPETRPVETPADQGKTE